tara:strand:+ start:321 stop:1202 length:882 start_codon:yes stop_codon:yes gene_type:complete
MHIPVLLREVTEAFNPQPNENYIDCTLGNGGHTQAILERTAPNGKVLGIDWDEKALQATKELLKEKGLLKRVTLVHGNYAEVATIAKEHNFPAPSGILLDLGYSSNQIDETERGFSFQRKAPLDMRYDSSNPDTAEKLINFQSRGDLEQMLKELGEEEFAGPIANEIVEARNTKPIDNTIQLVEIIKKATPAWYHKRRINPATKTFQALRIAVNRELENLEQGLPQALNVLKPQGILAVISFHSLEDKVIKEFARENTEELILLTKKPITPSKKEVEKNKRSSSGKLRTMKKK